MITPPYPELDELCLQMGEAGQRLCEIDACEGAAGNLSVCLGWPVDPRPRFPLEASLRLPVDVPALAGHTLLVTGSGCRLREILRDPEANLGCLVVQPDGRSGGLYTAPRRQFQNLTSELNTHLAIHADQVAATQTNFHAVVHAQPLHLTYLSHIPAYADEDYLNHHLLRWQPESIVQLPDGLGFAPFQVPGSPALMQATLAALRTHNLVIWARHGVMARSDVAVKRASDRVEYAETAARYEYLNLAAGQPASGLSAEEIRAICAAWGVQQTIF